MLPTALRHLMLSLALLVAVVAGSAETALAKVKFSALAVDARTGDILFASDPDGLRHPASLTKVMTLYILFQELKAGRLTMDSRITMSRYAAGRPPTKLGVGAGQTVSVEDAIKALVTLSANDVAVAIGENIAGSESGQQPWKSSRRAGGRDSAIRGRLGQVEHLSAVGEER